VLSSVPPLARQLLPPLSGARVRGAGHLPPRSGPEAREVAGRDWRGRLQFGDNGRGRRCVLGRDRPPPHDRPQDRAKLGRNGAEAAGDAVTGRLVINSPCGLSCCRRAATSSRINSGSSNRAIPRYLYRHAPACQKAGSSSPPVPGDSVLPDLVERRLRATDRIHARPPCSLLDRGLSAYR
jgi:hypothetical protein